VEQEKKRRLANKILEGGTRKKNWFEKKGTRKLLELNYQINNPMDENGINQ
jgi:hypothetical protein